MAVARDIGGNDESRAGHVQNQWQALRITPAQTNVSDDEDNGNTQKRRRVSKACDRCRQGKLKCNGGMPRCSTCLEVKKPCTYGTTTRRRGLRTGYVRALECLWGLVFQSIEGSEDAVEKLIATTTRRSFWVRDDSRDGPKIEESPLETWKMSRIPQAVDDLLSMNEETNEDSQAQATALSNAPTPTTNPKLVWTLQDRPPSSLRSQPSTAPRTVCQRCRDEVEQQTWKHVGGVLGPTDVERTAHTAPDQITQSSLPELPSKSQKLLDLYFALTHSWFPVVERHVVYRSLFAYRKRLTNKDLKNRKSGEEAVLWAILTYATVMHSLPGMGQASLQPSLQPPNDLYMAARNNIPMELEDSYSNGHVQALLILALLHYSSCQWSLARILTGQAILLAGHIGLDRADKCQTDHHRRIWLSCFVLDTLTSVHTEKPAWIRSYDVQALLPPLDEASNEEWEPWNLQGILLPGLGAEMAEFAAPTHTLSIFNKLLELLCITNNWMHSKTSEQKNGCRQALKSWDDGLPEHIRSIFAVEAFSTATVPVPANVLNLQMIHALLRTRLSNSTSTTDQIGLECSQEWKMLVGAIEGFFGRFDQRALPPSFNLLRSVLPQRTSGYITPYELMAELKQRICNHESAEQLSLNLHNPEINDNENVESTTVSQEYVGSRASISGNTIGVSDPSHWVDDANVGNTKADTFLFNLDPRIEQNFGSFINTDGPWTNVLTDLLAEPQTGNAEDIDSQMGRHPITTESVGDASLQGVFYDDGALDAFSAWDDVEVQERDQFRRNLGFKF